MTLSIDPIEAFWVLVNTVTAILTVIALIDARQTEVAVRELNGRAREIVAHGNVRREWFRLLVQLLLLMLAAPGLFVDRPIPLSPPILTLITIPIVLLISTLLDYRERRKLVQIVLNTPGHDDH